MAYMSLDQPYMLLGLCAGPASACCMWHTDPLPFTLRMAPTPDWLCVLASGPVKIRPCWSQYTQPVWQGTPCSCASFLRCMPLKLLLLSKRNGYLLGSFQRLVWFLKIKKNVEFLKVDIIVASLVKEIFWKANFCPRTRGWGKKTELSLG